MAKDDVARCLMALDDPVVRERLASGDWQDVDGDGLSEDERALVTAAAADDPETIGFALQIEAIRPGAVGSSSEWFAESYGLRGAIGYAEGSSLAGFNTWAGAKQAQGFHW